MGVTRTAALTLYSVCSLTVVALLLTGGPVEWGEVALALLLQALVGMLLLIGIWAPGKRARLTGALGVIAYLVSVALLRDGAGATAGYGPLVLLPVVWSALRSRRGELAITVAGVAAIYLAPVVLIGGSRYPPGAWHAGVLFVVVSAGLGIVLIHLVARVDGLVGRLNALARTDELTGVANRRAWTELLGRELSLARRTDRSLVVAMLDLDFFKEYNDEHGHPAADRLLRTAVAAWEHTLRDTDVLARWGGDEFALLLPACDSACATLVVERMRRAFPEAPFSAGIAESRPDSTFHSMIAEADVALYRAKRDGRSSTVLARKVAQLAHSAARPSPPLAA